MEKMQAGVTKMIDNMVRRSLTNGNAPLYVIDELRGRSKNIFKIIEREKIDMSSLFYVLMGENDISDENIPKRVRYAYYYVTHCDKRISDLNWLHSNKSKFRRYSNSQMIGLFSLRDKLSK